MSSLLKLWITNKESLASKSIEQIIHFTGDGKLRDNSTTPCELRDFLANIPADQLTQYISECLESSFNQSGMVLQDLVNEVGRRLGFKVTNGLYRGGKTKIAYDGLWETADNHHFVIEVKTTDAYHINLDTQAVYRQKLIDADEIKKDRSSILLVVGRNDTGGLEAQTRGSRHAWDTRIISVDALIKLMRIKENLTDKNTVTQIHQILKPLEYTRVDRLIDIMFSTSEDLQIDTPDELSEIVADEVPEKKRSTPVNFHQECISNISHTLKAPLIKQGRCSYATADQSIRVISIVSKEYNLNGILRYWYAFRPSQQEFLKNGEQTYIAFGCGSFGKIILIPYEAFEPHLSIMRTTESEDRFYWHVEIFEKNDQFLLYKSTDEGIPISKYKI